MKTIIQTAKRISILAFFAASTMLFGCNAADLAGPQDAPQSQSDCESNCSNGRNL